MRKMWSWRPEVTPLVSQLWRSRTRRVLFEKTHVLYIYCHSTKHQTEECLEFHQKVGGKEGAHGYNRDAWREYMCMW